MRLKDSSVVNLFASPENLKRDAIETILAAFPGRTFILVGDSGERDPEIYGALARGHARQIVRILIRDVTGQDAACERYKNAFQGVAEHRWMIFRRVDDVEALVP